MDSSIFLEAQYEQNYRLMKKVFMLISSPSKNKAQDLPFQVV